MNTIVELNNLNNIQRIKTLYPIVSKYCDYKNKVKDIFIPGYIELDVTEVYPNFGVDVFYEDRNIFLYFEQIEVIKTYKENKNETNY